MIWCFAGCEIDTERHELRRSGEVVHVEPQVFDLIKTIVAAQGALVSHDDLIQQVWHGRIVSDATMSARISAARSAVGDNGKEQRVIATVARRGFRLSADIETPRKPDPDLPITAQTIRYASSRDGTGIAFAVTGEGPPLLRGGHWLSHLEHDWHSPVWRPLLESLGANRTLVRYDPRNTGLSEKGAPTATIENSADDMQAVADAAGIERFSIFAASQSAPAALVLAARRPERVSRLVLWGGFAQGSAVRGDPGATEAMVALIRSGWGVADSAYMRAFATLYMPSANRTEVENLTEMHRLSADRETAADLRRAVSQYDASEILERIQTPVLILHARGDAIHPVSQAQYLARHLPNAGMQIFDSDNHVPVTSDSQWQAIMDATLSFLDGP